MKNGLGVSPIGSLPFKDYHFPLYHDYERKSKQIQSIVFFWGGYLPCQQKIDLATNSKLQSQSTIFQVNHTMKRCSGVHKKLSVFFSFSKVPCGKGTLPKTNVAPENCWLKDEISSGVAYFQGLHVSFRECSLLCWCCHATAAAAIPPKSHSLAFLDLSVSGVAYRLHTQKRLQVCGYTSGIMKEMLNIQPQVLFLFCI